jgi:hypothetical protein
LIEAERAPELEQLEVVVDGAGLLKVRVADK